MGIGLSLVALVTGSMLAFVLGIEEAGGFKIEMIGALMMVAALISLAVLCLGKLGWAGLEQPKLQADHQ